MVENKEQKQSKPAEDKLLTKQRILAAALDLFSVYGFSTVSMRELGKAVGIKESSIYYHFHNKVHILEMIFEEVYSQIEIQRARFMDALQVATSFERQQFIATGIYYVEHILLDNHLYKLIRMLTIEKQHNEKAAEMYTQLLFHWPLKHQERVFTYMMNAGLIKQDNAEELAAEYQAIILYVFQKYFLGATEFNASHMQAAKQELEHLLARFYNRLGKGDGLS